MRRDAMDPDEVVPMTRQKKKREKNKPDYVAKVFVGNFSEDVDLVKAFAEAVPCGVDKVRLELPVQPAQGAKTSGVAILAFDSIVSANAARANCATATLGSEAFVSPMAACTECGKHFFLMWCRKDMGEMDESAKEMRRDPKSTTCEEKCRQRKKDAAKSAKARTRDSVAQSGYSARRELSLALAGEEDAEDSVEDAADGTAQGSRTRPFAENRCQGEAGSQGCDTRPLAEGSIDGSGRNSGGVRNCCPEGGTEAGGAQGAGEEEEGGAPGERQEGRRGGRLGGRR